MKKLIRIVIAIQMVLMLTHCASSTDQLYSEYAACRSQTLHVKTTDTGVVILHPDGGPIMIYETGACPDELAKWEKSHAMKEKRRREREAYQAASSACGEKIMWCTGRHTSKCISRAGRLNANCNCDCVDKDFVRDVLRRSGY